MRTAAKITIPAAVFAGIMVLVTISIASVPDYSSTIFVDAAWHPGHGHIKILYQDRANSTESVRLEVLGLEETFQKTFTASEFSQDLHLDGVPANGWRAHPVTFDIVHGELGRITAKTEVHGLDEPAPPTIYGAAP